ncbi:MAG: 1-deoxy-D-xylulose-5-phosphate synthase [Exilispira sp.]
MNYDELKKLSNKSFYDSLTIDQLNYYADLLRKYIIQVCSKKSTHLASNLGTIEIFLALNKVFDFARDYFVFDVGHQIYAYKILTGRFDRFPSLREFNGISGFPDPEESNFDLFKVGHVGCGLPLALGLSEGIGKNNEVDNDNTSEKQIITLLGDGSLTNGAMLEALNYISNRKNGKIIIILNDNEMSISRTVPSIVKKLSLFATRLNIRGTLEQRLKKTGHSAILETLVKLFRFMKNLILPEQIFEDFNIRYIGPIDGHNIKELIEYFNFAKNFPHTILVHVKTTKGKGFKPAEENPELFHSAPPFNVITGEVKQSSNSFTNFFGKILVEKARLNKDIYAITAAMKTGCGLDSFEREFKDRFIDVGIAESLAVSMAAGLAKIGKRPVVAIYSIFLTRAASQVYHDIVLNHLPAFFAIDRSGIVGIDGPTHHGLYIYPFLCSLPDIYLFNCGFIEDMQTSFSLLDNSKLPVFMQYPKDIALSFNDEIENISIETNCYNYCKNKPEYRPFEIIKIYEHNVSNQVDNKTSIAIVSIGSSFSICKKAFINLFKDDIFVDFYYMSMIKPFMEDYAKNIIDKYKNIIIVDESPSSSYVYQKFCEISAKLKKEGNNFNNDLINLLPFTLPDKIITHGTREQLFNFIGFSSSEIVSLVKNLIKI